MMIFNVEMIPREEAREDNVYFEYGLLVFQIPEGDQVRKVIVEPDEGYFHKRTAIDIKYDVQRITHTFVDDIQLQYLIMAAVKTGVLPFKLLEEYLESGTYEYEAYVLACPADEFLNSEYTEIVEDPIIIEAMLRERLGSDISTPHRPQSTVPRPGSTVPRPGSTVPRPGSTK